MKNPAMITDVLDKIYNSVPTLIKLVSGQRKETITFKQYFSKIKASFRLRELSPELKKKVLNLIENKILWDGRRIVIDYTNKIILIGNF